MRPEAISCRREKGLEVQHVALGFPYGPAALNVSVFSLPESYEGWLNHLPSPCALARAASIYCQDPSANGEAAVDARDKLVLGEGAS